MDTVVQERSPCTRLHGTVLQNVFVHCDPPSGCQRFNRRLQPRSPSIFVICTFPRLCYVPSPLPIRQIRIPVFRFHSRIETVNGHRGRRPMRTENPSPRVHPRQPVRAIHIIVPEILRVSVPPWPLQVCFPFAEILFASPRRSRRTSPCRLRLRHYVHHNPPNTRRTQDLLGNDKAVKLTRVLQHCGLERATEIRYRKSCKAYASNYCTRSTTFCTLLQ